MLQELRPPADVVEMKKLRAQVNSMRDHIDHLESKIDVILELLQKHEFLEYTKISK